MKGRPNNKRRLRHKKVLLVLDDVDSSAQLHYLIDENLSLGPNSKVIITSRDRHILVSGGVHVIHEVKELGFKESLQLFCRHAFKQAYPKMGYERLSTQAVQYAKGLPLALKVLGSHLNSRDAKSWESALKKLRKYPNMEIQTVLRASYDGLDIPEKRIFLDIAFFFDGENKEDIIRVLDACDDLYVDCGIDRLLDKALITISRDNRVEIHDLLQEMAEEIVREESRENSGRRSRLNDAKEIQDVLYCNTGTGAIEGITLNPNELDRDLNLSVDTFQKMSNLRVLNISSKKRVLNVKPLLKIGSSSPRNYVVNLPDGLASLSNKLMYFCWEWYPLESLPMGFSPKQLVEIHLPFSSVVKLWDGMQDLMNLRMIDLSYSCKLKELPNFTMAQNLEVVDLSYCKNLWGIHPSLLSLPKLASLNLMKCLKLKNLHGHNHLKSLKNLTLSGCIALEEFLLSSEEMTSLSLISTGIKTLNLPVGRFNKLEKLHISGCLKRFEINELRCLTSLRIFSLASFREGIEQSKLAIIFNAWHSLEELHLIYCQVYEIPENINMMSSLKILTLRGCNMESLPNSIKLLSKLKQIDLGSCKRLRSLPEVPPSITHFYVDECTSLETIIIKSKMIEHDRHSCFFSWVKALEWGLDGCDMTEFLNFKVMLAIYTNKSSEVKVCYPGSTIPKGFTYSQMGARSITVEIAPSYSDHLLGFICCCILPPLHLNRFLGSIRRKFHFDDEDMDYRDEKEFPIFRKLNTSNVFVCYDPSERIVLKGSRQKRRYEKGTTFKFACEFFIEDDNHSRLVKYDDMIKGCGIWPIYASDLQEKVAQIELKLEKGIVSSYSSGLSENPKVEVAQHQPARDSVRGSTLVRQRNKTTREMPK